MKHRVSEYGCDHHEEVRAEIGAHLRAALDALGKICMSPLGPGAASPQITKAGERTFLGVAVEGGAGAELEAIARACAETGEAIARAGLMFAELHTSEEADYGAMSMGCWLFNQLMFNASELCTLGCAVTERDRAIACCWGAAQLLEQVCEG
jgi:hypothetical protein